MASRTHLILRVLTIVGALVLAVCLLALVAKPKVANAAFPGGNGRLALSAYLDENYHIATITPGGTDLKKLTQGSFGGSDPAWSPDSKEIAFSRVGPDGPEIYVMKADGSDQRAITDGPGEDDSWNPTWSPNGEEIAFQRRHVVDDIVVDNPQIYVISVNGARERQLTNNTQGSIMPEWSPDGTR